GFSFLPSPGHSIDHACICFNSRGEQALFWGDVMHHPLQFVRPDWNSVFCEFPEAARKSRQWAMNHAAETNALVSTTHFAESSVGRVCREGDRFTWHFALTDPSIVGNEREEGTYRRQRSVTNDPHRHP